MVWVIALLRVCAHRKLPQRHILHTLNSAGAKSCAFRCHHNERKKLNQQTLPATAYIHPLMKPVLYSISLYISPHLYASKELECGAPLLNSCAKEV